MSVESSELDDRILKGNQMLELLEEKTQHAESVRPVRRSETFPSMTALLMTLHLLCSQERQRAETRQQRLRRQMEDYQVPDVTEYMQAKARLKALQAAVHSMQRKVAIAEVNRRSQTSLWLKQRHTRVLTPQGSVLLSSWFCFSFSSS